MSTTTVLAEKLEAFDAAPSLATRAAAIEAWESSKAEGATTDDLSDRERELLSTAFNWLTDETDRRAWGLNC
jgi:hypothetical protein